MVKSVEQLIEDVVAGDSGGNPDNIASGTNSGAVVSNPGTVGTKSKQKNKEKEIPEKFEKLED